MTGQASSTSPFMKMRDTTHSGQKVLMKLQDLETVTSMMYNMSLQQGKTKKLFKPQVYRKKGRGQRPNYDRDRSRNNNRQGQGIGQNRHRNDYRRNGFVHNFSRNDGRDRGRRSFNRSYISDRSRSMERSLSSRRYNNNNNRQNGNSRLRSRSRIRSNSRITMNRDRIRCYKCMEYDHFANECPNIVTKDSDGHESDNAALKVMAIDTEPSNTHDIVSYMEDTEYLN